MDFGTDRARWQAWWDSPVRYTPTPLAVWQGVPIMPGAQRSDVYPDAVSYMTEATTDEIRAYYKEQMAALGWEAGAAASLDPTMHFRREGARIEINVFTPGDLRQVYIMSR